MKRTILAATMAACFGCQSGDAPANSQADPSSAENSIATRPDVRQGTIMIEGMAQPSTSTLMRAPDSLPLDFSAYVPEGIEVEADAEGVRFVAAFDGSAVPDAYMYVSPYPPGTGLLTARNRVGGYLRTRVPHDDPLDTDDYPDTWELIVAPAWALEAYSFAYPEAVETEFAGRVMIAEHQDRLFHVIIHYPVEFGDGLAPRFDAILDSWRWEDTGRMLVVNPPAVDGGAAGG